MLGRTTINLTAVALTVAAALPTVAIAGQDLRSPDTRDAAQSQVSPPQDLRSPDARDAARSPGIVEATSGPQDLRSPDTRDAARGVDVRDVGPVQPVTADSPDSGFQWGDAGIGAAGMLGLVAIVLGGSLLVGRRRHDRLPVAGVH